MGTALVLPPLSTVPPVTTAPHLPQGILWLPCLGSSLWVLLGQSWGTREDQGCRCGQHPAGGTHKCGHPGRGCPRPCRLLPVAWEEQVILPDVEDERWAILQVLQLLKGDEMRMCQPWGDTASGGGALLSTLRDTHQHPSPPGTAGAARPWGPPVASSSCRGTCPYLWGQKEQLGGGGHSSAQPQGW